MPEPTIADNATIADIVDYLNAEKPMVSLYFAKPDRRYSLDLVDTYTNGVVKHVLPVFDHMEQEADEAVNQRWLDTGNEGTAFDRGLSVYRDLKFVREQVIGLAIGGLYHLWERLLKEFIIKEYRSDKPTTHDVLATTEAVLRADFPKLAELLKSVGWPVEIESFYSSLDCLRLVANVVKHRDGPACRALLMTAPSMFFDFGHQWPNGKRGASDLLLKREDFPRFVSAVREFFEQIPERLPRR